MDLKKKSFAAQCQIFKNEPDQKCNKNAPSTKNGIFEQRLFFENIFFCIRRMKIIFFNLESARLKTPSEYPHYARRTYRNFLNGFEKKVLRQNAKFSNMSQIKDST